MTFSFRPAVRENTPLIIGISGPTKSGKTYSAHRLAIGLAPPGGIVAMINAEGARGHQYADRFKYVACDITSPYSPQRYTDALKAAAELNPAVLIIDSASHMHDGPGGLLEYHRDELNRLSRNKPDERDKYNWTAWIEPKAAENAFIYAMLALNFPVVLAFRAKEKLHIVPGQQPKNLGWQPIAGDRITFETLFTLVLPPHSKGVPDKVQSEMREPFDAMVDWTKPVDEALGRKLAEWAKGRAGEVVKTLLEEVQAALVSRYPGTTPADKETKAVLLEQAFGTRGWSKVQAMDEQALRAGIAKLRQPVQVRGAQETDRGAADDTKAPKAPTETREGAAGTAAPGSTKVSPLKEPARAGNEPAPGLFPTAHELRPTPPTPAATAAPHVRGIDIDDESQALVKLIEAEKEKLERQPSDAQWEKVCEAIAGTSVLDMADPDALRQLLELVRKLVEKDADAIERVTEIIAA